MKGFDTATKQIHLEITGGVADVKERYLKYFGKNQTGLGRIWMPG